MRKDNKLGVHSRKNGALPDILCNYLNVILYLCATILILLYHYHCAILFILIHTSLFQNVQNESGDMGTHCLWYREKGSL